jgi:prepilin-type N-terminal cleavage/methylation domain-containing protein
MKRKSLGFTLLELMITVGIVAALAAMAVAGYGFATQKTRRAAAQGCLTEAAGAMERYYTSAMTYRAPGFPRARRTSRSTTRSASRPVRPGRPTSRCRRRPRARS